MSVGGHSQRMNRKFGSLVPAASYPWQADSPLPSLVEMDLLDHFTQHLLSQEDGTFPNALLKFLFLTLEIV